MLRGRRLQARLVAPPNRARSDGRHIVLNVVPFVSDYLPWWLTLVPLGGAYVARLLIQNKEPADGDKA